MTTLPTGTVTFLFTDIEGSTRLVQELEDQYLDVLHRHGEILRSAISQNGGIVVSTEGDSFFAVFTDPLGAVRASIVAQKSLLDEAWPGGHPVRVRMGIHTGQGTFGGDNYAGLDVHRAARIAGVAYGGQVLMSGAVASLTQDHLPTTTSLVDLGMHRLKDLALPVSLLQLVEQGLPHEFPQLRSIDATPNNLPVQLTSFVSRSEVGDVIAKLAESRLVTLTGPGGTGKTRLSLQVAGELAGEFVDGAWFVELAEVKTADLVTVTVAATLGLQPSAEDADQRLAEYLRSKNSLLVLDNFEQVVEAAPRVGEWLRMAPGLKVLVSSRIPLRISGELEYPVPPLPLPHPDSLISPESLASYGAIELFMERAQAVQPDFQLTAANATPVAAIVHRLDGLPLAIELAAARIKVLQPAALLDRLTSRLSLLTGGARDQPERQRTLRGAIEWSYELLDGSHQTLYNCLGAFSGSFALEQAEAVCAADVDIDVFDGLTALVDHSLLRVVPVDNGTRFIMLETISELAREHLEASPLVDSVRRRHAEIFLALAEQAAGFFTKKGQRAWLDRIALDHDNLRSALAWAIHQGEADLSFRFVFALWRFWQMRGWLQEGRRLTGQVLDLEGGSVAGRRDAHEAAGGMAYWQADENATIEHYLEALRLAEEVGDPGRLADCLYNAAVPVGVYGDPGRAAEFLGRARLIAAELGDRVRQGTYEWGMGTSLSLDGLSEEALPYYDKAYSLLEGTDAIFQIGWVHRMKATSLLSLGRISEAEEQLQKGLTIFADAGDTSAFALHVRDFAEIALARDQPERALILAGASTALETVSETRMLDFISNRLSDLQVAVDAVGREMADKLMAEGRSLSIREILELVQH